MVATSQIITRPQKGYQEKVLASPADIIIGGGAAGSGKTFSLLLDFLHFVDNPEWGGVIFRRTTPQIRNQGGLWDTSMGVYIPSGGTPKETTLEWKWPSGAKLKFSHLEYEQNVYDWQGSQVPFIGFDELTHFSETMFFYLLSRNRSTCGIRPYVRATCNPDPDSWVAGLIGWWINEDTGFPIPERDGKIRYFLRDKGNYIWGDTRQEVIEKAGYLLDPILARTDIKAEDLVKSITFISGSVYENRELLGKDPAYLANLLSQDEATRSSLLEGNWKVVLNDLDLYEYYAFLGMFDNVYSLADRAKRYITADVALKGSNFFVVGYWEGFELMDIAIRPKTKGNEVVDQIKALAYKYQVPNQNITYDNDGVGGFVDGFIPGAVPFVNGSAALMGERYANFKTQCYYKSADRVNRSGYKVNERVASKMFSEKRTVRQQFIHERKAIKRDKPDADDKLRIISKEEMKVILSGDSPDLMDMFMMRESFEIRKIYKPF